MSIKPQKTAEILAARFDGNPTPPAGPRWTMSFDLLIDGKWIYTTRRMEDMDVNRLSTDKLISVGEYLGNIMRQYGCEEYQVTNGDCIRDFGNGVIWVEEHGGAAKYRDTALFTSLPEHYPRSALEVDQNDLNAVLGGIEQTLKGDHL